MIPVKLELTNFLSYRQTVELDFAGIHLACISGSNGAGKSSILDAITWALFGKCRSKNDDDVVNRIAANNNETAEVKFTFQLENNIYRIIRRKTARKTIRLELQLQTDVQKWKSLTEHKLRETEEAIEHLLRMNYDSFINASFLLQGKADEFTTKTPNRRKEILSELIGATKWELYRLAAQERRKAMEGQLQLLDARLGEIERELNEQPERQKALQVAEQEQQRIKEWLTDKEQLLIQMRRVEATVKLQRQALQTLSNNLNRTRQSLASLRQSQQQRQQERLQYQSILERASQIQANYAEWEKAEEEVKQWQTKLNTLRTIQQQQRPYELTIAAEESRLKAEWANLQILSERVGTMRTERQTVLERRAQGQAHLITLQLRLEEIGKRESQWHEARALLQTLENERKLWQQELSRWQNEAARAERDAKEQTALNTILAESVATVAQLKTQLDQLAIQREQFTTAKTERDTLQNGQTQLKETMNKLKARMDRLAAESGDSCPLCGQPLTESHKQTVLAEWQAEGKEQADRYRQNQNRLQELDGTVKQLETNLKQAPVLERELNGQQQRLATAEAKLEEGGQRLAEWETTGLPQLMELKAKLAEDGGLPAQQKRVTELAQAVRDKDKLEKERLASQRAVSEADARLTEIDRTVASWEQVEQINFVVVRQKLESGTFAEEAREQLSSLQMEAEQVGYSAELDSLAQKQQSELRGVPALYRQLSQAQAAIHPLETALTDLASQIHNQETILAAQENDYQQANNQLTEITANLQTIYPLEEEVNRLREEEIRANRLVGMAHQRVTVLDDLRRQNRHLLAERIEQTRLIQRLKMLEQACGRDGVQALLIEQALPEIEYHANDLLERLTDGQMRVTFETQKQLKSRDELVETLDIRLIDSSGERPYENFSGGEQFRVNFAIRLALSRVLTKRAGARLQTLVVDEGFGSQDPHGRQRLAEAIHTIQDDFQCILVITHIDQLRDAFSTRIEVEKRTGGSTISVFTN